MDLKTESLKKVGLTDNESRVYLTLLEIGAKAAGTISRKTGLHRRVVYDVTDRLTKKGLIGYILENNKKIFHASNPKIFLEILDEEKKGVEEILPGMMAFFSQTKEREKQETNFYRGKEGLKTIFEDEINEGKEILILGASPMAYDLFEFYFHWFDRRRIKNKIKAKIIFNKDEKFDKIPFSEIKYLSSKSSPMAINIYGDRVAIIYWNKESPFAILIKQKEIAESFKNYFNLLWETAKK